MVGRVMEEMGQPKSDKALLEDGDFLMNQKQPK